MRKVGIILCTLIFNLLAIKVADGINNSTRLPASEDKSYTKSCIQNIKSFFSNDNFSLVKYEEYFKQIDSSKELNKFENIEHYVAYIDKKIGNDRLSLAKYLVSQSKSKKVSQFIVNSSRPDKLSSFLFDGIFEELLLDSIKVNYLSDAKVFALKRLIDRKSVV